MWHFVIWLCLIRANATIHDALYTHIERKVFSMCDCINSILQYERILKRVTHATKFWGELTWKSRVVVTWHPSARAFQSIILPIALYKGVLNEYRRCLSRFHHDDGFAIRQWSKGLIFKISRVEERYFWVYLIRYDVCVHVWRALPMWIDRNKVLQR